MSGNASGVGSRELFQTAWVVEDLDATVRHWGALGVGPFFVFRNFVMDFDHRGRSSRAEVSFALAQAGPMQIELVAQHCERGSAYRDVYRRGESGLHHVGRMVKDYDAAIKEYTSRGLELAMSGVNGGVHYGYLDTRREIGCMTEIVGEHPGVIELYKNIRLASLDWDGVNPFREMNIIEQLEKKP